MLAERNHYSFCKQIGQSPSTNYAGSMNGFKMGWMEVAGNMFPPIIGHKLPVVKARVPNQKRPREWRVGLKILGGCLVVDGRSKAMMANWLWMMLDWKNNEHTEDSVSMQKSVMLSRERQNTRSLDLCVPILLMIFGTINGVKTNSLGRLVGRLSLLYMGVSS